MYYQASIKASKNFLLHYLALPMETYSFLWSLQQSPWGTFASVCFPSLSKAQPSQELFESTVYPDDGIHGKRRGLPHSIPFKIRECLLLPTF